MISLAAAIHSSGGLRASRRPLARLLGVAPAALLLGGLMAAWAGPLAAPVAAAAPTGVAAWSDSYVRQASVPTGGAEETATAASNMAPDAAPPPAAGPRSVGTKAIEAEDASPDTACTSSLAFGMTYQCSIDTPAETDTYTFSASAGDKAFVRMSTASSYLYPGLKLYAPDGTTKLCENTGLFLAEIASCTLPSTGTYSVQASDSSGGSNTGTYGIFVQRLNNPGNTTAIGLGHTISASIDAVAETDSYTFAASAGDKAFVRMSTASSYLYPGVRLYGPDGTKLCDNSGLFLAEVASCSLPSTGTYTVLAFDSDDGSHTGTYDLSIALPATHLRVSVGVNPWPAGSSHSVTVTALDRHGNVALGYRGTVHFTTSDSKGSVPADYTFIGTDLGVHTFATTVSPRLTFKIAGTKSVTATDMAKSTITGSKTVTVTPAAATHFKVSVAVNPWPVGSSHSVTVTALDSYGNVATGYRGTIHFTTSDTKATVPADYAFTAADAGVHTFPTTISPKLTFKTAGSQWIRATDKKTSSITGVQTVTVQ